MKNNLSAYQNLIILLISIILHALLLLAIIVVQLDHPQQEATVMLAQNEEPDNMQSPERDWVTMQNSMPAPPVNAQTPAPAPAQEQPEEKLTQNEPPQKTKTEPSEQEIEQAVALAQHVLEQSKPPEPPAEEPKKTEPPPKPVEQLVKQQPKTPPITLAQLTDGFMQHLQESPMMVKSDRQGQASMEQIQHMNYCQKIIGCIVNSYLINKTRTIQGNDMNQTSIQLAINQNGSIHTLTIVRSSGNITVDRFLLHIFQDASSSFPPLPTSLKEQPYYLPLFNVDRLEAFQSTQGWYIDNSMPRM